MDLVFGNLEGGFLDPSNVRRDLYKLMRKVGVRRITFHDLRHTHASLLIKNGEPPKVVMHRLGHKDIEMTLRYYAHLYPNADKIAIENLENENQKHKEALKSEVPTDQM